MDLNLNNYQFKTSRYSYRSIHMNFMVDTNQKPTTDTQKPKEMNRNIPLKKIIKSQGKKIKEKNGDLSPHTHTQNENR